MIAIGKVNVLKVIKQLDFGIYLDALEDGEILMPKRYVPQETKIGDMLDAFIYRDSEDKLIATTEIPLAEVGDFAYLEVVAVNNVGAFVDWGLPKDLLVPFSKQKIKLKEGDKTCVYIYLDEKTKRIVASAKIEHFFAKEPPPFIAQEEVDILIYKITDLGYKVVINQAYDGILFKNEVFQKLQIGETRSAYIKQIREDGKIDVSLSKIGYEQVIDFTPLLLNAIRKNEGFLPLNDSSSAEEINNAFGVSKKVFKKAVGDLYRKRMIRIEDNGLYFISK